MTSTKRSELPRDCPVHQQASAQRPVGPVPAQQAGRHPRHRDRALRPPGLRVQQVGRHRRAPSASGRPPSTTTSSPSSTASMSSRRRRSRPIVRSSTGCWRSTRTSSRRSPRSSRPPSTSPTTRSSATASSSPSRPSWACTARPPGRKRRASSRARACATSSSPGPRSSRAGWSRASSREADPRLLARAILGLYNSVWHWYRPGGDLTLDQVRDFFVARCLAVAGIKNALAAPAGRPARRKAAAVKKAA